MFSILVLDKRQNILDTKNGFTVRPDEWTQVNFPDTDFGRDAAKIYVMEMMKLEYTVICQLDLGE